MSRVGTLLVANRGEIAVRIFRTARAMGIKTVAVYSDADRDAMHVTAADEAISIGRAPAADSYLNIANILTAAKAAGADAIHPGYGFLSENPEFARAVSEAGLVFIGPSAESIAAMADKARAKTAMIEAGVPVVPGWQGENQDPAAMAAEAEKIGYPLLVKAAAGGGGRGMRVVREASEVLTQIEAAGREARSAFGDDTLLLERFVPQGRHVEVQILADMHGHTIALGERDCSVQRRRQKVIEEAPCPALDDDVRQRMSADAVAAAEAVNYLGAGTVEFLLAEDGAYYFLEMNTRLQVEHPVTEEVMGIDLVRAQIEIARGEPVCRTLEETLAHAPRGHAIEARLYAEDPARGFAPQAGRIRYFDGRSDETIRIDAGVRTGGEVSSHYDPMVAKFIAHGATRKEAAAKLRGALLSRPLLGLTTNRRLLLDILDSDAFASGEITTADLDRWEETGTGPFAPAEPSLDILAIAALVLCKPAPGVLRSASVRSFDLLLSVDGQPVQLAILQNEDGSLGVTKGEETIRLDLADREGPCLRVETNGIGRTAFLTEAAGDLYIALGSEIVRVSPKARGARDRASDPSSITAPVSGTVVALDVEVGEAVEAGQTLLTLEAMKMEMRLVAEASGIIKAVYTAEGEQAASGAILVEIDLGSEG